MSGISLGLFHKGAGEKISNLEDGSWCSPKINFLGGYISCWVPRVLLLVYYNWIWNRIIIWDSNPQPLHKTDSAAVRISARTGVIGKGDRRRTVVTPVLHGWGIEGWVARPHWCIICTATSSGPDRHIQLRGREYHSEDPAGAKQPVWPRSPNLTSATGDTAFPLPLTICMD